MRFGHGTSYGAVSILNAIPCGTGSSIGIDLRTEVMFRENEERFIELADRPELDDKLVSLCVERTLQKLDKHPVGYFLRVWSDIPPSIGLKSSSSVCNAVISAVLDHYDVVWDPMDVITLGVECAKECGVTITGAFDDACCCMFGGMVVANNITNKLLSIDRVPEYDVVICIPDRMIEKKDIDIGKYEELSKKYSELVPSIAKDCFSVMEENGRCVGKIIGCDLPNAKGNNVIASGISGTGPASFVITKKGKGESVARKLKTDAIITHTRSCLAFTSGKVEGTIDVPRSKSYTHRAIFMAALSGKECVIREPLMCNDTKSSIDAVKAMGADVKIKKNQLIIKSNGLHSSKNEIYVGNSGTTLRFITAVASMFPEETEITGDESVCNRTVGPLVDALGIDSQPKPPLTIKGPIKKSRITVDGSESSQFVSAILMISPLLEKDVDITIKGRHVSEPYVAMTVGMMKRFGIDIEQTKKGYHVRKGQYDQFDFTVPRDYSAAAYPLVAGGLAGKVTVKDLDPDDLQGDKAILDILARAGCKVTVDGRNVTCENAGRPKAIDVDLSDSPDLFPVVAVLLSVAKGKSRLYGAPHLRLKESDRITSTVRMLRTLGANVSATEDGCVIKGVEQLDGGKVEHNGDHRMMMAATVASLVSKKSIYMDDDGCWNVSYPDFIETMDSLKVR